MTLKVNKILHIEQSKYQDVLVFESETFGNVLVLDGAIQCTERDEFSYQEMIAHLPLASHPNPKKVLVIGGGDGGVVREVLQHESVEHVVLCDIDEAVIRVSKQYLPHMSSLLSSPRVEVYVGDGFAFLQEHQSTYDVIITDSSDPVGPAQSLFEKPYFQLLHDSLTPGGHISTQAECLWLHSTLIKELQIMTRKIFTTSEYAFTTIPTYPGGQIGFIVASKGVERDLAIPLRKVPNTRYYNSDVHKAAYMLPEFARALLQEGKDLLPKFGRNAPEFKSKAQKKVLLLGSGFVALPCAEYLARDPSNAITIACRTLASAESMTGLLPTGSSTPVSLDVNDSAALEKAVAEHDLVISLIPYTYHAAVIKAACKGKTDVVTTSYISDAMRALEEDVKAAGIKVLNEIGLDPGIDHLYAVKTIDEVHAKGGKVKEFYSYCGGLPAPEHADNPLGYKFSWSSRGVLLALLNPASFLSKGKTVDVQGSDLMSHAKPYYVAPGYSFVAYPNRNSVPFRDWYGINSEGEGETVVRGTMRYEGFPEFIAVLVKMGFLKEEKKDFLTEGLKWRSATAKAVGASSEEESAILEAILPFLPTPNEPRSPENIRIVSGLRWIGLFSDDQVQVRNGNLLDTLCGRLEGLMKYEDGERDFIMLQHKFIVQWADGKLDTITSTGQFYGYPTGAPGSHSAMSRTVGVPCGIAVQLILDGTLQLAPGIHAPYTKEICDPIREQLEREGLQLVERVL